MYLSKFPLTTYKEAPADAEVISHQLMLRAGMIRRLASGLYNCISQDSPAAGVGKGATVAKRHWLAVSP